MHSSFTCYEEDNERPTFLELFLTIWTEPFGARESLFEQECGRLTTAMNNFGARTNILEARHEFGKSDSPQCEVKAGVHESCNPIEQVFLLGGSIGALLQYR